MNRLIDIPRKQYQGDVINAIIIKRKIPASYGVWWMKRHLLGSIRASFTEFAFESDKMSRILIDGVIWGRYEVAVIVSEKLGL